MNVVEAHCDMIVLVFPLLRNRKKSQHGQYSMKNASNCFRLKSPNYILHLFNIRSWLTEDPLMVDQLVLH